MSVADPVRARVWAEQIERGIPATRIAKEAGVSRHTVTKAVGDVERPRRERRQIWSVPVLYREAAKIAKSFGLTNDHGEAVGDGSPGKMIDEIGAGRIICRRVK